MPIPTEDREHVRAIQSDSLDRALTNATALTPQELQEQERMVRAYHFEHGDHQPDGTVLPVDPETNWLKAQPLAYRNR